MSCYWTRAVFQWVHRHFRKLVPAPYVRNCGGGVGWWFISGFLPRAAPVDLPFGVRGMVFLTSYF